MALADCQAQIRDLVMGPGTDYQILSDFDPWSRQVRADQGGPRAWAHGSWSGAEWAEQAVVPIRLRVRDPADGTPAGWLAAHQRLTAAFAPSDVDLPLLFVVGGVEYVMFGRPRLVEPEAATVRRGYTVTRCAFIALDPLVYSGVQHSEVLVLPTTSGGLTAPVTAPVTVTATVVSGRKTITNAGTAPAGLVLRIDGPVQEPRVSLLDGATSTLRFLLTLNSGQWLDVDIAARTVYLNGTVSRRGQASGDWPTLSPGEAEIAFDAAVYNASTAMSVTWRDAWF